MSGFHIQRPTNDWLDAVERLPENALVLAVDGVQWLSEAKARNPQIKTILRHHEDSYQVFPLDEPFEWYINHAKGWFPKYIDGTFRDHAHNVDYVKAFNEIYASDSHTPEETRTRIWWERAAAQVWHNDYRSQPDYAHIRLVIGSAAVGNEMPVEIAEIATRYDCVVSYHSYYYTVDKQQPEWEWDALSGKWDIMDMDWQEQGHVVDWMATESGPFESAATGWRHRIVCDGDVGSYLASIQYFHNNLYETDAYQDGRWLGEVLFTTFPDGDWEWFDTRQTEMNKIANAYRLWYEANPPGSGTPVPPPPPPPPPEECRGAPRTQYARIKNVVPSDATEEQAVSIFLEGWRRGRETVGGSYDDAGIGDLDNRSANLYGIKVADQQVFIDWYTEHYPGVSVSFLPIPGGPTSELEIVNIVNDLPKHATLVYSNRSLDDITTLTIHHTVSPPDRSIASIAAYHVDGRGWPGIAYGFVISDKGTIYQTNHLTTKSYHAGSYNAPGDENLWSVGIALQGDFTDAPPPQAQLDAAKDLVQHLKGKLGPLDVLKHRDMPGAQTACPGNTWAQWFDYVALDS